ncbi:hypothetical protein DV735_g5407, partial [Chaetothyriales sp. CBS 134920]
MADHAAGSRAIKIPLHPSAALGTDSYDSSRPRRRRGSRHPKSFPATADSLEAGGPSSSVSSEAESAMSSHSSTAYRPRGPIASPSDRDPRLPGSSNKDGSGVKSTSQHKGKGKAASPTTPPASPSSSGFQACSPLGPSMLASSSYKSINLNAHNADPDEPPRLITYTKHSQGFIWNDELFLPSYLLGRFAQSWRRWWMVEVLVNQVKGIGGSKTEAEEVMASKQQQQHPLHTASASIDDDEDLLANDPNRGEQFERMQAYEARAPQSEDDRNQAQLQREFPNIDGSLIAAIYNERGQAGLAEVREMLQELNQG